MRTEKQGFRIIARHPAAIISMAAFALCIPTQILGYAHRLNEPLIAVPVVFLTVLSTVPETRHVERPSGSARDS